MVRNTILERFFDIRRENEDELLFDLDSIHFPRDTTFIPLSEHNCYYLHDNPAETVRLHVNYNSVVTNYLLDLVKNM